MDEQAKHEAQFVKLQEAIDVVSPTLVRSANELAALLGTHDLARINAAKDGLNLATETIRSLTDEQRAVQRRLEFLVTERLTRASIEAAQSASRATWATFWIALCAMVATSTIVAAFLAH